MAAKSVLVLLSVGFASASSSSIKLLASDAATPFKGAGFSYPRLSSVNGSAFVGSHVDQESPTSSRSGVSGSLNGAWAKWQLDSDPSGKAHSNFSGILDWDLGGTTEASVLVNALFGDSHAVGCESPPAAGSERTQGWLAPENSPHRSTAVHKAPQPTAGTPAPAPHMALYYAASTPCTSPCSPQLVVDTLSHTLPGTDSPPGYFQAISLSAAGSVAFSACSRFNGSHSGVYVQGPSQPYPHTAPLERVADTSTIAPGSEFPFVNFFGLSIEVDSVAFTANHACGDVAHKSQLCSGIFSAHRTGEGWALTRIAFTGSKYQAFGDPTLAGGLVGFVAMDSTGGTGMYVAPVEGGKIKARAKAGQRAPGGAPFASFPQPPSISNGELVFRAYVGSGDTGIYHADKLGLLRELVSTKDLLEGSRSVVYMGSAERAFMVLGSAGDSRQPLQRAYTFYASTVGPNNTDARDGIYLGDF